jgi:hypothetical protein
LIKTSLTEDKNLTPVLDGAATDLAVVPRKETWYIAFIKIKYIRTAEALGLVSTLIHFTGGPKN